MPQGKIKKIVDGKGFGFIETEDGSKDLFFHATGVVNEAFDSLQEGDTVNYEVDQSADRPRAKDVSAA